MSKENLELLTRGAEEIIPEESFLEQINSKKKLRVKAGFDPTSPDLHLGHTVLLNKMKIFQDLGHEVIFLIGDFTGLVGDPSGVNETRPVLTEKQLSKNAETYREQVFKILDPNKTEIRFNSEWMSEVHPSEFIKMLSSYTVARMLERDDFTKRHKSGVSIALHEFLYQMNIVPVMIVTIITMYFLITPKLPNNINNDYKRRHFRYDNNNFNNVETRY